MSSLSTAAAISPLRVSSEQDERSWMQASLYSSNCINCVNNSWKVVQHLDGNLKGAVTTELLEQPILQQLIPTVCPQCANYK